MQIKGTEIGGRFKEVLEIEQETNECKTICEENLKDERIQKRGEEKFEGRRR